MRKLFPVTVCALAVLLAVWLADADRQTDDTGIVAGLILIFAAASAFALPRRPLLWALLWGLAIPARGLLTSHFNPESLLALVPAFLGAFGGAGLRHLFSSRPDDAPMPGA